MAPCPCCFAAQLQAVYDPVVSQPKQASEKPAKELGKGKQKAPDAMQGSAKKPKTRFENLVENAQRWRRTHGLSMEVNKANKKRWMATVSAWFEERKALLAFLDIQDLQSATMQIMVKFEAEWVTQVMDKCAGRINVQDSERFGVFWLSQFKQPPQDMQEFNTRVYDMLQEC